MGGRSTDRSRMCRLPCALWLGHGALLLDGGAIDALSKLSQDGCRAGSLHVMDGLPKRFRDSCLDTRRSGGTSNSDQKYCREMECRRLRRRGGKGGLDSMKSDGKGRDCISPKEGGESSVLMWVKRKASNQRAERMGVDEDARSHWPTKTPWVLCDPHFTALCAPGCSAALLRPWATLF
jgi:hypothetical protein